MPSTKTCLTTNAVRLAIVTALINTNSLYALDDNSKIEKIVVTGQKFDRTLQETPASVAVLTTDDIEDYKVHDLYDVAAMTTNVTGEIGNGGYTIRGIDAFNVSGGGNSFLTSVYVDGSPLPEREIQQGGFSTWDISQVEILRGPQSTLQGRNSLAGAIVVNTRDPEYQRTLKGRTIIGEGGQKEYALALGGALVDDMLAFRFTAEDRNFDGFHSNKSRTAENPDFSNSQLYRFKLLFEPNDDLSAILSHSKSETEMGVLWTDAYPDQDKFTRTVNFDNPTWEFTETDITTLNLKYYINDIWSFNAISTYSEANYGYEWDGDKSPEPQAVLKDKRKDETLSQELRLTFDYSNLKGVFGLYYSDLEIRDVAKGNRNITLESLGVRTLLVSPPEFGGLGLPRELAQQVLNLYAPANPVLLDTYSNLYRNISNKALFADVTYSLSEQFDIFAGIRFDKEKQTNSNEQEYNIGNREKLPNAEDYAANPMLAQLINGLNSRLFSIAAQASKDEPTTSKSFSEVLPKLGVSYRVNDDITTSISYQKGYRSGGVGSNIFRNNLYTYDAEYTDNYEFSFRSTWLDGTLVANANVFYIDWKDQQINVQLSGSEYDSETTNAGRSKVVGFETELFYYPTDELSLMFGIGKAHTEFTDFIVEVPGQETIDKTGEPFAESPEWTANAAAIYRGESGLFLSLDANYQSSASSINIYTNIPEVKELWGEDYVPTNESRTVVNARIGYEWDNYQIQLAAKNLLDEEYVVRGAIRNVHTLSKPRQLSLSISAEF
ncbi:TonB-dependent receptor (plasmid) [Pseudoalteromonas sp. T1lg65]|uniref:TonB-dependent receptor n=1 Tax=Pseudoalteromonas sp. T1lg65 TaxID=2077101 RepID=UPI003F7A5349